ncbi:MAG: GNAT family N-acetyltransferase, partial [Acidocella sp.]|nr:GNAT family N-acetyltransferase [Acidocella sp.]
LVQDEALALVAAYKVPVIKGGYAATPEEAALVATTIGYPVVVKLSHPNMPANRTTGSIALDVPDGKAVRAAAKLMDTSGLSGVKFLVQKQAPRGVQLRIRVADSPQLGPTIGFGAGGGDRDDVTGLAVDLPPLNLPLAHALIARSAVAPQLAAHRGAPAADLEAIAATLVRVSQLIIDTPEILLLDLDPIFANEDGVVAVSGRIALRPAGEARAKLVISPYPAELTTHYEAKGHKFTLRPIRPEDADAHAALFSRMPAEDMRYRFFSSVRQLAPEQIARLTDIDYGREMAIIAVNEATGETAGAARLVRNDTDGRTAEFACAVEPAAKGIGLATALMRAIIAWGKAQGVEEISGTILSDNTPMLAFVKSLGFSIERVADDHDIVEAKLVP